LRRWRQVDRNCRLNWYSLNLTQEKALDEKNWLAKKCEGLAESTNKKQQ
jgi:hypothetical protein